MVNSNEKFDLGTATLNRILDDLKFYQKLFSEQPDRLAVGMIIRKNVIDVQNCLAIIRKHGRALNALISSSYEERTIQEVDGYGEAGGVLQESDDEADEATEDRPGPTRGILDSCDWPEQLADVNLVISTFSFLTKDRSSLLTADFHSCESMFDQCHKCVDRYRQMCDEIDGITAELKSSAQHYMTAIMKETRKQLERKPGVGDRGGLPFLAQVNTVLRSLIDEIALFAKITSSFKTNLDEMKGKIQKKSQQALELWAKGEAKMHRYFIEDSHITSPILCWVKADRKTMTRSMLTCTLTKPEDIHMELGNGECLISNAVTLSSTDGRVLQAHKMPITIFIPFQPHDGDSNTETVVMTKTGLNGAFETTEFKVATNQKRPCIQITRQKLSMLIVVALRRPVVYQQVVDSSGATIIPPTDETVKMEIPAEAISGKATVSIKTIPEKALPVAIVQSYSPDLVEASSMVFPTLPKEMNKPAHIKMTMDNPSEEPDTTVHAVVCSKEGWSIEKFERSTTTLGTFNVALTADTDQVVMIKTRESADGAEAKMLAQAIAESINERIVNFLVMQHRNDQMLLHIDCCKREYGDQRAKEAEEKGYVMISRQQDVYLMEGAVIVIRCSGDITFNLPGDKTELEMHFSGELLRPVTFYIKANSGLAPTEAGGYLRGYIEFVVSPKDLGLTEKRLRRHSGDADVTVSTMPISIKQVAPEKATDGKAGASIEYLYRCAESIAHVLTRADLLRLAEIFQLKTSIERMKQNPQSLTIKNILNIWYLSTKVSLDKFAAFAEALRKIEKDGAAETIEKMARTYDSQFLEMIRILTEDSSVLTDAKLFLLDLGLSDADYTELEHKNARSIRGLLTDGLLWWRDKLGGAATYDLLVSKLKAGRHMRAADLVVNRIQAEL